MKPLLLTILTLISINSFCESFTKINNAGPGYTYAFFQGKMFFFSTDATNGDGLYYVDGVNDNLHFVKSIIGQTSEMVISNNHIFFVCDDGSHGNELWISDGTSQGTFLLKDIAPGLLNSLDPYGWAAKDFQNKLYFIADDGTHGKELWISDGTLNGTNLFKDINTGSGSAFGYGAGLFIYNNELLFNADATGSNNVLWSSDGSSNNTNLFLGIYASKMTIYKNKLWVAYDNGGGGQYPMNIIIYDGSSYYNLSDSLPYGPYEINQPWLENEDGPIMINGKLLLNDGLINITDGTTQGTTDQILTSRPKESIAVNSSLYFVAEGDGGLYVYDSSMLGTPTLLAPNMPSYGAGFVAINNKVLFQRDDAYGKEPWVTDGTTGGTSRLKDINPGSGSSMPTGSNWGRIAFDGYIYFNEAFVRNNIWRTDGTSAGTTRVSAVADSFEANKFDSRYTPIFNNCLYFNATSDFSTENFWKMCSGASSIDDMQVNHLAISPNPTTDNILLTTNGDKIISVSIYNLAGELCYQVKNPNSNVINTSELVNGIYITEVQTQHGWMREKFVKM